ncbi:hypothetical protein HZY97_06230 [Sphingomonas sp. R-74633]|uniref:hypothetical protein n=1 Tax=Sphingomonas sp. R-74633 TaxID=2751188 RepID=UPI0015D24023|nr:hypothetical protein [Sphingomonas sp. R-74633]NYT40344.1 hypothetical protein [Sphingomonas sp. R-74633]
MTDSRTDIAVTPPATGRDRLTRLAHSAKTGALKLAGTVRTEAGEAIEAAGVSVARLHRRMILVIAGLILVLLLGAVFRALGMAWMNYALIALVGLGAAWAFLQPMHLAGMLLVGGGVAALRGMGDAGATVLGYAKLLGRVLLALLVPLLLFALAPGDRSLGASLPFLVLAPFVLLASWMFGKLSPKVEQALFVALPLGALLIALGNMLVPERTLAGLGVPAWLRAGRPQDEELATVERLRVERANALRAEQLRAIRRKLEANQPLDAADEAVILAAQKDRVTLTGWFGDRYTDLAKQVKGLAAVPTRAVAAPVVPPPGTIVAPGKGWSARVVVPAGFRLCHSGAFRAQCHPTGKSAGLWIEGAQRCLDTATDAMRFRGRRAATTIDYRFVAAGASCASR